MLWTPYMAHTRYKGIDFDLSPLVLIDNLTAISEDAPDLETWNEANLAYTDYVTAILDVFCLGERPEKTRYCHAHGIPDLPGYILSFEHFDFPSGDRTTTTEPVHAQEWVDAHQDNYDLLVLVGCNSSGETLECERADLLYPKTDASPLHILEEPWRYTYLRRTESIKTRAV